MLENNEKDTVMKEYYGDNIITALISVKVDTKNVENIALKLLNYSNIEDIFLVTGDSDLVLKIKFLTYDDLKKFIVNTLGNLEGIQDTSTMMVVTSYKERGNINARFKGL
ncbi:MAG: Lrp/AsnC family transcriptional regulator [Thermoplasmata archaeon]